MCSYTFVQLYPYRNKGCQRTWLAYINGNCVLAPLSSGSGCPAGGTDHDAAGTKIHSSAACPTTPSSACPAKTHPRGLSVIADQPLLEGV